MKSPLLLLALVVSVAQAQPLTDPACRGVKVEILATSFETLEQAAISALGSVLRFGIQGEQGGYIIEDGGIYRYSRPQTQSSHNTLHFCRAIIPGTRYVARYHTHPPGELGFSSLDKRGAAEDQVLSFVGVMRENAILRYNPANGRTDTVGTIDASNADRTKTVQFVPRVTLATAITVKVLAKFTTDPAYFGPGAKVRIQRALAAGTIPEEVAELMKSPDFAALVGAL